MSPFEVFFVAFYCGFGSFWPLFFAVFHFCLVFSVAIFLNSIFSWVFWHLFYGFVYFLLVRILLHFLTPFLSFINLLFFFLSRFWRFFFPYKFRVFGDFFCCFCPSFFSHFFDHPVLICLFLWPHFVAFLFPFCFFEPLFFVFLSVLFFAFCFVVVILAFSFLDHIFIRLFWEPVLFCF